MVPSEILQTIFCPRLCAKRTIPLQNSAEELIESEEVRMTPNFSWMPDVVRLAECNEAAQDYLDTRVFRWWGDPVLLPNRMNLRPQYTALPFQGL